VGNLRESPVLGKYIRIRVLPWRIIQSSRDGGVDQQIDAICSYVVERFCVQVFLPTFLHVEAANERHPVELGLLGREVLRPQEHRPRIRSADEHHR